MKQAAESYARLKSCHVRLSWLVEQGFVSSYVFVLFSKRNGNHHGSRVAKEFAIYLLHFLLEDVHLRFPTRFRCPIKNNLLQEAFVKHS